MDPKFWFIMLLLGELFFASGVSPSQATSRLTRRKRSDDSNPLEAVVQDLSQQVTSLVADVNALKASASKQQTAVAFYVWHNTNPLRAGPSGTLIMNHVATNQGNGYDSLTGVFTVPVSGLYDFQATFMSYVRTVKKVYAAIYVDTQLMAEGVADSQHNFWDQSTIRAVVHVTSGQRVYVKNTRNSAAAYYSEVHQPYTTFSGFLVKAD